MNGLKIIRCLLNLWVCLQCTTLYLNETTNQWSHAAPDRYLAARSQPPYQNNVTFYAFPYEHRTTPPAYPGGISNLMRFIAQNYRYPRSAVIAGVRGTMLLKFYRWAWWQHHGD